MGDVRQLPNYDLFRKPRLRVIRQLNDIAIAAELAQRALIDARLKVGHDAGKIRRFIVPTGKGDEGLVNRTSTELKALLDRVVERDLFQQALVPAVAITESYLGAMLFVVLRAFPKKLGGDKRVDLELLLSAQDLGELLRTVIWRHIYSAFYDSPAKYLEYVERTLGIAFPGDLKTAYAEAKATRDICVHNAGVVNHLYLQKAGSKARGAEGEEIPVDEDYLIQTVACLKKLVEAVYQGLPTKYGKTKGLSS